MSSVGVEPFTVTIGSERTEVISELPSFCPRCRSNAVPTPFGMGVVWKGDVDDGIDVPVCCSSCGGAYIVLFQAYFHDETDQWTLSFMKTIPDALPKTQVSPVMKRISRNFARVFDEAAAAQTAGLEELAGAGYRRALEFLVKDYLCFKQPEKRNTYISTALRNCIKDHFPLPEIRDLADRAALMGNDYAHYKALGHRDIIEMVSLINLIHKWIDLQEQIAEANTLL
jgi:hypothetical protein